MRTMNHQYFCKWFYNDDTIAYVLSQNTIIESGEETNPDLIDKEIDLSGKYANQYERDILEGSEGKDYKLITFKALFIPLYFYFISIIVGILVSLIFKENKKNNILLCLIISLTISLNTNYLIYPIVLFIMLIITKYLALKTKICF